MHEPLADWPTRLDAATVSGLIEEHADARLAEVGPEPWAAEYARWRGACEALDAAARGGVPRVRPPRPPSWLQGVAQASLERLATSWGGAGDAMTVRALERLGLVQLDHDDTYVLAFVGGMVGDPRSAKVTRAEVLRADPELREAIIWRVFEVEGGGEVSLANLDKFSPEERSWSATFHELVADGTLARGDVLTASLGALTRDFSAYRAGWYSRLYRSLDPTPAESAERQHVLRHLLRSGITATVTLALRSLLDVTRAGLLEDDATAGALEPALQHGSRSSADLVLRLVEDIARRRPDLVPVVTVALVTALTHPHHQVQERAARLLRTHGGSDQLAERAQDLSPAVAAWLGLVGGTGDLAQEALAGADVGGVDPGAGSTITGRRVPAPVTGGDLVERAAALLEDASDAMEVEALLAGLAAAGPTDALAPLSKRASTILSRGPREGVTPGWLRGQLARLVLVSPGSDAAKLPWSWAGPGRPRERQVALPFLSRRIHEVALVLAGAHPPGRLLATPQRSAGWVDAASLVPSLLTEPIHHYDLIAALLRLGPEGRAEALAELDRRGDAGSHLTRTQMQAVRHALGAPAPRHWLSAVATLDGARRALWTAAARARTPEGVDPWAERLGLVGSGRAAPIALSLASGASWRSGTGPVRDPHSPWVVVEASCREVQDDQPTAITSRPRDLLTWGDAEDYVPWVALLYPADADHLSWVVGLDVVDRCRVDTGVRHDAVRVLDALRDHEGRLGRLTQAVLAAGLSAAGVDERAHAVDAVARLAATGRLDAGSLGAGIVDVGPLTPLGRMAGSLRDLAAMGPAGSGLVADALAAALPLAPKDARGAHALLEVLLDVLVRTSRPTPAPLLPWLAGFGGTSRAARLATRLAERAG